MKAFYFISCWWLCLTRARHTPSGTLLLDGVSILHVIVFYLVNMHSLIPVY